MAYDQIGSTQGRGANASGPRRPEGGVGGQAAVSGADRAVAAESLGRTLLAVTARALGGPGGAELDRTPGPSDPLGAPSAHHERALARDAARRALPADEAAELDAESVAAWIVGRYGPPERSAGSPYPAAVIGSPHGAAAHLAAALGAPWLPSGFECAVRWPGGAVEDPGLALRHGFSVAHRLRAANAGVAVCQVHDPVLRGRTAGATVTLVARWQRVPAAYRSFLATALAPGAPVLLVADARPWPVFDLGGGLSFQLGSPVAGLEPEDYLRLGPDLSQALRLAGGDVTRWQVPREALVDGRAEHSVEPAFETRLRQAVPAGRPLHQIRYARPSALSTAVAEVVRGWLARAGREAGRLVVDCGRLLDPGQALRGGLVPYWCESALRGEVSDAEWWLAGSPRFDSIDVFVEPPGRPSSVIAPIPQWRALAWFGVRRGTVDRTALRSYPYGELPTRHAGLMLASRFTDAAPPRPLPAAAAVAALAQVGRSAGLARG